VLNYGNTPAVHPGIETLDYSGNHVFILYLTPFQRLMPAFHISYIKDITIIKHVIINLGKILFSQKAKDMLVLFFPISIQNSGKPFFFLFDKNILPSAIV
jgi:hypothetical protein